MSFPRDTCAACGRDISVQGGRFRDHGDPRHGTGNICVGAFATPAWIRTEIALRDGRAAELSTADLATHLLDMLDSREYLPESDTDDVAIRELVRRAT